MHIDLTEENKVKYLHASHALDKSVPEIVNAVLSAVDVIDLSQSVKIEFKTITPKQKRKIVFRTTNYRATL